MMTILLPDSPCCGASLLPEDSTDDSRAICETCGNIFIVNVNLIPVQIGAPQ